MSAAENSVVASQLAAEIEIQSRLREHLESQLQIACESHDKDIAEALMVIDRKVTRFQEKKRAIFAALRAFVGDERASEIIQPHHEQMMPASYKCCKSIHDPTLDSKAGPGGCTPVTSPRTASIPILALQPAAPVSPASLAPPPVPQPLVGSLDSKTNDGTDMGAKSPSPKKFMAKRSRQPNSLTPPHKRGKTTKDQVVLTKRPDVDWFEVEGVEYIFQYPPFGTGWFVLRCDLGQYHLPRTFTSHPFGAEAALEHFNRCKTCKGHDTTRTYEADDIVMNYGHRVKRGDAVLDEEWVKAANRRLESNQAKTANLKARGKKPIEMGPANRSISTSTDGSIFVD